MDLSQTIIPRSDQTNADDLISGPRTIRVTSVSRGSEEQPVVIHYEGDNGRPYKPGLSMRRVLITFWGSESSSYVGRRMTLFRDPLVRFGSDDVGGIRISHIEGITKPEQVALTVTRGKRKPYIVKPLSDAPKIETRDMATLEAIAESKIKEGADALTAWAATLTRDEKIAIGRERFEAWKEAAK